MLPSIFSENLFDDFFDNTFDKAFFGGNNPLYGKHAKNLMKTDVKETDSSYKLAIDLPGFQKDEVNVELKDGYGINSISGNYYKGFDRASNAIKVTGEDFDIADLVEDDAVLVTVADGEIQTISDCELIAGTVVDAFESSSNASRPGTPSAVEIDGTEYKFADAAEFDVEVMEYYSGTNATNLKDLTYNVYLDAYGYVIGIEEVEKVNNYVFITGIDMNGSNLGARTATANAIFLDGTMATIDINVTKSDFGRSEAALRLTGEGNPILNTWYTYTVNSSKVYTVTEVSNVNLGGAVPNGTTVKYAQYNDVNNTGDDKEIDSRNIYVAGNAGVGTTYSKVYGTDETVYLTVDVEQLNADNGNAYGIVKDVESVVTGIGNASLLVWDEDKAADEADKTIDPVNGQITTGRATKGVYALYNDKGDVIAAIVVGEDAGSSKNLVYVHSSSIYRESYNATTEQYTWTRKVISNGQEVLLTEVGDGVGELEGMLKHNWYQVKYNAEGNVIEVTPVATVLTDPYELITNFNDIDTAVTEEDTVLYYGTAPQVQSSDLKLVGKTLWLNDNPYSGFRVDENVNVALIQWNNNTEKTYFETGTSALKNIVNDLNERHDGNEHGYIVSAILEKGVATSIVIYDYNRNCDPYSDGDWEVVTSGKLAIQGLSFGGVGVGMEVTYQNKTGKIVNLDADDVTVVVKNAETGAQVYAGPATSCENVAGGAITTVANDGYGVMVFNFNTIPGNSGKYTVELTVKDGTDTYIGTATLATV